MIDEWGLNWGVSQNALLDLKMRMGMTGQLAIGERDHQGQAHRSEAYVDSLLMLEAGEKDVMLFRNNSGAFQDKNGRWIRFGLANESKSMSERIKSPDRVGFRKRLITQAMVGSVLGQAVFRECKEPGWQYTGVGREVPQATFLNLAASYGCDAAFCTGKGSL